MDGLDRGELEVLVTDPGHGDDVLGDASVHEQRLVGVVQLDELRDGPYHGQQQRLLAAAKKRNAFNTLAPTLTFHNYNT